MWWDDDPGANRHGFGIVFHTRGRDWVVHRILVGSSATTAGIQSGDIIHAISGRSVEESLQAMKLSAIIELLDSNIDHKIVFRRGQKQIVAVMRPRVLREFFEAEAKQG